MAIRLHADLAAGRWHEFTLAEQLGNIGGEVHRAAIAQEKNAEDFRLALYRALELIDLTLADSRHRGRLKEIGRLRELVCDAACGGTAYHANFSDIDRYLVEFAVSARLGR